MESARFGDRDRGRARGGVEHVGARGGGRGGRGGVGGIIIIDMVVVLRSRRIPWRGGVLCRDALECRVLAARGDVDGGLLDLGSTGFGNGDLLLALALVDKETAPVSFRLLNAWNVAVDAGLD